jgi:hypothetical protein
MAQFAVVSPSPEVSAAEEERVVESRKVITRQEALLVQGVGLSVWLFIFVFGIVEHMHNIRQSCKGGDPLPGHGPEWLTVNASAEACAKCSPKNDIDCDMCAQGYYNLGTQCFKYLENLPAIKTGAALGGLTYFVLIVGTQCLGILTEVILIRRLVRRKLMPRKELIILLLAMSIELARMFLVDIFVMQEYFGGRAYKIFREPQQCQPGSLLAWQGADAQWYCNSDTNPTSASRYYIASQQQAWSHDENTCSTFTTASSLLSFDEAGLQDVPGHTRFKTMGWIIGGEFALYYFFATFINEVADNMFVVPTTTSGGWLCKIFAIALEVFQLGALCPAAIFSHKDCLHYTDPLGVSLHTISSIVVVFGYLIWGFVFMSLPLAVGGMGLLGGLFCLCSLAAALAPALRMLAGSRCWRCCRCTGASDLLVSAANGLENLRDTMQAWLDVSRKYADKGCASFLTVTMAMAFIPMLCGGMFLGTLVVVGQASKQGFMQMLTAIVLLSDVLFKIVATGITEIGQYMLHLRVKRIVATGENRSNTVVIGQVLGVTAADGQCAKMQEEGNAGAKGKCQS